MNLRQRLRAERLTEQLTDCMSVSQAKSHRMDIIKGIKDRKTDHEIYQEIAWGKKKKRTKK